MSLWCDDFYVTPKGYYVIKVIILHGYYIKVYQGYYVTMTLTNHRPFQNRPTLDAKKCIFAHRRVVRVGYSESSALKTIV